MSDIPCLKQVGKHWLFGPIAGQYHHLNLQTDAKNVELIGNFLSVDEELYEIKIREGKVVLVRLPRAMVVDSDPVVSSSEADNAGEAGDVTSEATNVRRQGSICVPDTFSHDNETGSDYQEYGSLEMEQEAGQTEFISLEEDRIENVTDTYTVEDTYDLQKGVIKVQVAVENIAQQKVEKPSDTPEEHFLFFKGLNPQTNRENLANFVEIITDDGEVNTEDIVFNAAKDSAVVVVQGVPDLMKACERVKSKGICGFFPQVLEIDPPKCIAVSCEDEIKNVEGLELYFEHPKAEGGEVVGQSYETEDGSCYVIEFKDPAVVKRVCHRRHEYHRKSLRVSPYYKCKAGEIWDGNLHVIKIPDPVRIGMTKHCVQLLQRDCCKLLIKRLEENYCAIEFFESSVTLKCKLNAKVDNFKSRVKAWELTSRQIVEQFIGENVTEQEIRIHGEFQDQVMTEIRQYIESENIQKIQEIVICIKETFQICIVGFANKVRQTHFRLRNKKTEVEKRLRRTSETWPFIDLKLKLLDSAGKFQEMRSKYEEIEVSVGDGYITVEGDPVDIKAVHVDVLHADSYIKQFKWKHGFFRHSIDFIQTKLKEKVSRCLKENGLTAEWEIDYQEVNGYLFVGKISDRDGDNQSMYSNYREEVDDYDNVYAEIDQSLVVNVFKNCLAEDSLNIPQELLNSEEGVVFAEDIVETYFMDAGIELTDNGRKLWIFGMRKQVEEISRKAKTFLDENAVLEDKMACGTIEVRFLQRHLTESTKRIENNLKKWKVCFELKDDLVKIWGTREGISKAKVAMRQLCASIKCEEHVLKKVVVKDVIRNEKGNGTIDVVENDTKCIIVLPEEVETFRTRDPEPIRRSLPKPKSRPSFAEMSDMHLDEFHIQGITLQVLLGDILDQQVNVIVSSVNDNLDFVGGVAQALQKKCPEVVKEAHRKAQKFKKDGLVFTRSYGLRAENIIHVKFVETPAMWKDQMLKCLEKAHEKQFKSIAFPMLGTGQRETLDLDPAEIAYSLFTAADQFAKKHKLTTIKKIHLVVFKTQLYIMKPVVDSLDKAIQWAMGGKQKLSLGEKARGLLKSAVDIVTGKTPGAMSKDEFQKMVDQTSSLSLKIYSDSEEKVTACIKELNLKLEKQYYTMKIEDYKELLKSLTPEEENELENTEIIANIKLDKAAGVITIDGPTRAVGDIKSELQSRLLKIDRRRNEVKIAEENYKLYRWYFEEITATGIEHIEYEKVLNLRIEQAYKANINQLDFKTDKGEVFVIDLVNLVEYPESDKNDTVKVLRKDILKQATAALPQEWAPMKNSENLRRVAVANTDQIYKDIEQRFLNEVKTGQYTGRIQFDKSKVQVSKIERIQNKTLYQQYIAKKKLISEQKPNLPANMPIERELWHGTTHDAVDSIEMHGFNRSYCGKNGIWFGAGVYFAKCASYSARGWLSGANPGVTGVKGYIFLSKVLTGQYCKGNDKMRYLPAVDPKQPTVLYDCAVDNEQNPMEFVIFHDTQAYPEYIITFTA